MRRVERGSSFYTVPLLELGARRLEVALRYRALEIAAQPPPAGRFFCAQDRLGAPVHEIGDVSGSQRLLLEADQCHHRGRRRGDRAAPLGGEPDPPHRVRLACDDLVHSQEHARPTAIVELRTQRA